MWQESLVCSLVWSVPEAGSGMGLDMASAFAKACPYDIAGIG